MRKKSILVVMFILLTLLATSTLVFADTESGWSDPTDGVQYQYINRFGGDDWDTLRWYNANSSKVGVTYTIKLADGSVTNNLIYLDAGQTTSEGNGDSSIAAGARVNTVLVQAQ